MAAAVFLAVFLCAPMAQAAGKIVALCTTFPIYQITRTVTQGSTAVQVELMLPAPLGCPHDYALTPQDMQKLARANVLIINGLGLEEFLNASVRKANPNVQILDSSAGIKQVMQYTAFEGGHDHEVGVNPHLFASPRMAAKLPFKIAAGLARLDPAEAGIYERNARAYALRLNRLADEFSALGRTLANNRIVTQHGVFDYLARDMGLSVVAVVSAHGGQEPSAAQMLGIIETIKRTRAGAVFTEPQYPARIAQTIAREAGIPAAVLDPAANGPANAGLDYYETVMRRNLATLKETLGTR